MPILRFVDASLNSHVFLVVKNKPNCSKTCYHMQNRKWSRVSNSKRFKEPYCFMSSCDNYFPILRLQGSVLTSITFRISQSHFKHSSVSTVWPTVHINPSQKRSSSKRSLKTPALRFRMDRNTSKTKLPTMTSRHMWYRWPSFPQKQI